MVRTVSKQGTTGFTSHALTSQQSFSALSLQGSLYSHLFQQEGALQRGADTL